MLVSTPRQAPAVPTLTYSADSQFTISNYDAGLTYVVSGCTRTGSSLTSVSNGATITAAYGTGSPSAARTMNLAAHSRVFGSVYSGPHLDAGCGPRGNYCCGGGSILNLDGSTCGGAPGTRGDFCGGGCGGVENCYGFFNFYCYNWSWTDYSGSDYTLIGSTWGKST